MELYNLPISFFQVELIEIQSDSLEEIALFSAKQAFSQLHQPLFTEDTGLFVQALNGFPGPYASFVFKTIGYEGILKLLKGISNRTAFFKTAIALMISEYEFATVLAEVQGKIAIKPKGSNGWGYDPIFIPTGGDGRTYGQMDISEKNLLSHRFKALSLLYQKILNSYPTFINK